MTLWIIGGALVIAVAATIIVVARRRRLDDLGSVSATWTTEHKSGNPDGDGSTS